MSQVPTFKQDTLASFIVCLYQFTEIFTSLPGNQSACYAGQQAGPPYETAGFLGAPKWGVIDLPPPFSRAAYTEEANIRT